MNKASLLCQYRDNALEALAASAGKQHEGLAQAARHACDLKLISKPLKHKLIKVDYAYNLVRHITSKSVGDYIEQLQVELNNTCAHRGDHTQTLLAHVVLTQQMFV